MKELLIEEGLNKQGRVYGLEVVQALLPCPTSWSDVPGGTIDR